LQARTLNVELPTAYDLTGETDGNCSLNEASMNPDVNGCYFRRRDVEQGAAAGITLVVGKDDLLPRRTHYAGHVRNSRLEIAARI
jgi:hypothetical protein